MGSLFLIKLKIFKILSKVKTWELNKWFVKSNLVRVAIFIGLERGQIWNCTDFSLLKNTNTLTKLYANKNLGEKYIL